MHVVRKKIATAIVLFMEGLCDRLHHAGGCGLLNNGGFWYGKDYEKHFPNFGLYRIYWWAVFTLDDLDIQD